MSSPQIPESELAIYPQTPQGGLKEGMKFNNGKKYYMNRKPKSPLGDLGVVLSELLLYLHL
jgi:hypothetical protein